MDFLRKFAERVSPGKELHIIGPAWASRKGKRCVQKGPVSEAQPGKCFFSGHKNKFEKYIEINSSFREITYTV